MSLAYSNIEWNKFHENLLKQWSEMVKAYKLMHIKTADYYAKLDKYLGIPIILLGAITASSVFSHNGNDESDYTIINVVNGILILGMTGLSGVSRFLNMQERISGHKSAILKFTRISMDIDYILSFPRDKRLLPPNQFISNIKVDIMDVLENSPEILDSLIRKQLNRMDKTLIDMESKVNNKSDGIVYVSSSDDDSNEHKESDDSNEHNHFRDDVCIKMKRLSSKAQEIHKRSLSDSTDEIQLNVSDFPEPKQRDDIV